MKYTNGKRGKMSYEKMLQEIKELDVYELYSLHYWIELEIDRKDLKREKQKDWHKEFFGEEKEV
jgi:hypothetical protein